MGSEVHLKKLIEETIRLYSSEQLQFSKSLLDARKLARPTFSFTQEIVKELMSKTRILRDVFSPADFDPKRRGSMAAANPDRHARAEFVQKLIEFVAKNKHPVQGCVASKLIAGLEPAKSNELLQSLARVALMKLNERQRTLTATRPARPTAQQQQSGGQSTAARLASSGSSRAAQKAKDDRSPSQRRKASVQSEFGVRDEEEEKDQEPGGDREELKQAAARSAELRQRTVDQKAEKQHQVDLLESLRLNLKKLRPKLDDMERMDEQLGEKLQVSLSRLESCKIELGPVSG